MIILVDLVNLTILPPNAPYNFIFILSQGSNATGNIQPLFNYLKLSSSCTNKNILFFFLDRSKLFYSIFQQWDKKREEIKGLGECNIYFLFNNSAAEFNNGMLVISKVVNCSYYFINDWPYRWTIFEKFSNGACIIFTMFWKYPLKLFSKSYKFGYCPI